uniref:Ubiquitin-like domain-containing protein n=1 Tax=Strigamia maritima TaxID=126957 RepID=T1JIV3_STRMM
MQIFIRSNKTHVVDFLEGDNISTIKKHVATLDNIPEEDLVFYSSGRPLEDNEILTGLMENLCLECTVRVLGGKVHGSLARAGKVKGQTPKVEKQEKKKKKTGRSKRRIQYNRRFVNVVPTFGKRKGPNANS